MRWLDRLLTPVWLSASLLLFQPGAVADDIDIYLGSERGGDAYVHLLLDYHPDLFLPLCDYGSSCLPPFMTASSYSRLAPRAAGDAVSRHELLLAVLGAVFEQPRYARLQLSLGVSNAAAGGTILRGFKPLGEHGDAVLAAIGAMPRLAAGVSGHPLQPSASLFEWYRYLTAARVALGTSTGANFGGSGSPDYDPGIITSSDPVLNYRTPFDATECPRLYSVLFALGSLTATPAVDAAVASEFGSAAAASFEGMLAYLSADTTDLVRVTPGVQPLRKSWAVGASGGFGNASSWAVAGGSGVAMNLDEPWQLERQLLRAFDEMTSGIDERAPVPASLYLQGQILDRIYLALFQPAAGIRWHGNIKKLRLHNDTDIPGTDFDAIVDAADRPAFASAVEDRGQLAATALSFWTEPLALAPDATGRAADRADGPVIARGGAGQKIPGFLPDGVAVVGDSNSEPGSRQLYVEPATVSNGVNNSLQPMAADAATAAELAAELGAASAGEALDLLRWARGQDVDDADRDGDLSEARSWLLGDILHSRPVALNYGATAGYSNANPNIQLLFGTGAGSFHILRDTATDGGESGAERLAFWPRQMLSRIKRRRENSGPAHLMPYGVDGAPVVLRSDLNSDGTLDSAAGDEAFVYFGLRRGGSAYYALDVSDPDSAPLLRWKLDAAADVDFNELALTFSTPVVGKVKFGSSATDVLIFAGGYNGGWDGSFSARLGKDAGADDDPRGNAVYIVDARSGELIWKAVAGSTGERGNTFYRHNGLTDSIPSAVAVLRSANGVIHRLYVGDSGGGLWRVDLPPGDAGDQRRDHWFISKIAELGGEGADDRRFFHAPDLVHSVDGGGDYDGILISSGDRAHPNETLASNYHFYLKDRLTESGAEAARSRGPLTIGDLVDRSGCGTDDAVVCAAAAAIDVGWRIKLRRPGEKSLASPLVDGGQAFLTSYIPASAVSGCVAGQGEGRLQVVDLANGGNPRFYTLAPGIPPAVSLVGNMLQPPAAAIPEADLVPIGEHRCASNPQLCRSTARRLIPIYWRELGTDDL